MNDQDLARGAFLAAIALAFGLGALRAFAGTSSYSVLCNVKIAAGLVAVAFAFQKLLGLNLPLPWWTSCTTSRSVSSTR